ncbi:chemotaxis protein CheW [Cardiobacteriaceae bacterium TAE3-ERU3]|nr:chemotaxis protein CheW [Cardiobacteriaceae bacterium TAE3-ERU3]
MKTHFDQEIDQTIDSMTPFQLLSYYADTALLKGALKENDYASLPSYLMFMAEGEGFLIPVENISSVIREKPVIKPLPFSPSWFQGLSSVRNEIVSVVSFSQLHKGKSNSKQKDMHYILLNGVMNGFLLEVDKLIGIRSLDVEKILSSSAIIDGYALVEGLRWQRINLDVLLATKLHKEMEF